MLLAFDFDGTILDSFPVYLREAEIYLAEHGLPMPDVNLLKRGYGNPKKLDYGWGGTVEAQDKIRFAIYARVDDTTRHALHPIPLFDGMRDLLHELDGMGFDLALVTSKPDEPTHFSLKQAGIDHLFDYILPEDRRRAAGLRGKPEPDMLRHVVAQLGHTPDRTIMIGDTEMDIKMGRAAGCTALGVTWGVHENEHLIEAGAHHLFDDSAALRNFLVNLPR